jgi:DNA-binding transcriptional regulator YiaG
VHVKITILGRGMEVVMQDLLDRIGWSQAHFSRRVGVSSKTVNGWCKEKPNSVAMAYLRMVSKVLGV